MIFCVSLFLIFSFLSPLRAEVYLGPEEAIGRIFPDYQYYKTQTHTLDEQKLDVFTVLLGEKLLGWAVALNEPGKNEPITFLVGIDAGGKVLDVYILEYREPHGLEIRRRAFLSQFFGKTADSPLVVGQDIDGVTQATISSKAAAGAVKKALRIIDELRKDSPHA